MSTVLVMSKIPQVLDSLKHLCLCVSMTHCQSHTFIEQKENGKIGGGKRRALELSINPYKNNLSPLPPYLRGKRKWRAFGKLGSMDSYRAH